MRTNGRAVRELDAVLVGAVRESDLALLEVEKGIEAPPIKRLGERHHALARLLASGATPGVAAAAVGLSASRVSILQGDATFTELVEFYRQDVDASYADLHSMLAGMSVDAANEIRRRLEEEPEKLTVGQLRELVALAADRTGFGPQSNQNVNVNVNIADRLEAARKRHAKVIEGECLT